jgi:hypothetical protein
MRTLKYYAEKAVTTQKGSRTLECDLTLTVDGEKFRAYEVSVARCDLLFFTDKGTLNYLVDMYDDHLGIELYNIERD